MKKLQTDILTTEQYVDRSSHSLKINKLVVGSIKRREIVCMSHYDQVARV